MPVMTAWRFIAVRSTPSVIPAKVANAPTGLVIGNNAAKADTATCTGFTVRERTPPVTAQECAASSVADQAAGREFEPAEVVEAGVDVALGIGAVLLTGGQQVARLGEVVV